MQKIYTGRFAFHTVKMTGIKNFLLKILEKMGLIEPSPPQKPVLKEPKDPLTVGITGTIDAKSLILKDSDRIIMSIDFSFEDILGWVEWDVSANKISLVQKSGAVADLDAMIPANENEDFKKFNKVFVITRYNQEKIMHNLSFVIRD